MARANSPGLDIPGSSSRANVEAKLQSDLEAARRYYGEDAAEYQRLLAQKRAYLQAFDRETASVQVATLAKQNMDTQRALMTESDARRQLLLDTIAVETARLQQVKATGEERLRLEQEVARKIQLAQLQYAQSSPLGQQFKQWSDLRTQMETTMTNWLNSSTDALAQFLVTGQTDWRALMQTIMTDLVRLSLRWTLGQMLGPMMGTTTKMGAGKGATGSATSKTGKMAAVAHSGGIVGIDRLASRAAHPGIFAGAQRFHSGGMIGGPKLGPNEVPIIAQKGEGVFTPGQMKALAGSGRGTVNFKNEITLNASGGSPEANADLASQVARQVEATTRQIVVSEIQTQMRPGGMFRPAY